MYQKLNQNRKIKVLLASLAFFMALGFILVLPFDEIHAQGIMGLPFGGRVAVSVTTGYPWTIGIVSGYCPPHLIVANFGPKYLIGQPFGVFFPPADPKQYYNYFTPGVAIKGLYYPVPNFALCPFYPVYYSSMFGTGATPF
ncbi:MAG: hypothetical protein KW793_01380 [Candidatus Doudnabacteria bacterium]|nr:hypothetical protein [Candidatus Doudnabacteria bacterium]